MQNCNLGMSRPHSLGIHSAKATLGTGACNLSPVCYSNVFEHWHSKRQISRVRTSPDSPFQRRTRPAHVLKPRSMKPALGASRLHLRTPSCESKFINSGCGKYGQCTGSEQPNRGKETYENPKLILETATGTQSVSINHINRGQQTYTSGGESDRAHCPFWRFVGPLSKEGQS